MSKISGGQFAALLLITDVFALLCLRGSVTAATAAAFLVSTAIQLLLAIPAISLRRRGISLMSSAKPFRWIYFAYIIIWGGAVFNMLWQVSDILSIPDELVSFIPEKLIISGLIAIVCTYAASSGFRVLSRAAVIAAALGTISIIVIIIGAIPRFNAEYLTFKDASEGFLAEVLRGFLLSGGMGSFVLLLDHTEKKPVMATLTYLVGRAVVWTAVILTACVSAGGIMEFTDFPIAAAAELSQPFASQRIDSLFLIVMAIFSVFSLSIQTAAASEILRGICPKFTKFRNISCLILMMLSAFAFGARLRGIFFAAAAMLILLIIPLLIGLTERRRKNA